MRTSLIALRSAWHALIGNHDAFLARVPDLYAVRGSDYGTLTRVLSRDLERRCSIDYNRLSRGAKVVVDAAIEGGGYAHVVIKDGRRTVQAWGLLSIWLIGPLLSLLVPGKVSRLSAASLRQLA